MNLKEYKKFIEYIKGNGAKVDKLLDLKESIELYKVFGVVH